MPILLENGLYINHHPQLTQQAMNYAIRCDNGCLFHFIKDAYLG